MTIAEMQEKILVAAILAPHGIHGAVSAERLSDNPRRFDVGATLQTETGESLRIATASPHKGGLLLTFHEVPDRNSAEKLRGVKLYVDADQLAPLPEGSYYHFQLIGLTVMEHDLRLGELSDVLPYTANDIYVLKRDDGTTTLIPALKSIVKRVDLDSRIMEVELPEGL